MESTLLALCSEGFCKNDGTCSYPDTNCTCSVGWEGPQCQTGIEEYIVIPHTQHIKPSSKAVCREGFCENGGKCFYPDITCNCTEGWTGNTCAQISENHTNLNLINPFHVAIVPTQDTILSQTL